MATVISVEKSVPAVTSLKLELSFEEAAALMVILGHSSPDIIPGLYGKLISAGIPASYDGRNPFLPIEGSSIKLERRATPSK